MAFKGSLTGTHCLFKKAADAFHLLGPATCIRTDESQISSLCGIAAQQYLDTTCLFGSVNIPFEFHNTSQWGCVNVNPSGPGLRVPLVQLQLLCLDRFQHG